ncbi:MAG: hypothetical protein EXR60_02455 [Dehalococcoidia bacterium]|nr:hypothetical protein [Dehalococcoidia bacterium]
MTEETTKLDYDRSVIGVEYDLGTFTVTQEMLVNYARAVGAFDPIYWDPEAARKGPYRGLVAMPTFISVFGSRGPGAPGPDLKLNFGTKGQEAALAVENYLLIRPGDMLHVVSRAKEVYAKTGRSGPMVFMVFEETFHDRQGNKVATVTRHSVKF